MWLMVAIVGLGVAVSLVVVLATVASWRRYVRGQKQPYDPASHVMYRPDSRTGVCYQPNVKTTFGRGDLGMNFYTDSFGFRTSEGKETPLPVEVLVLGCSWTMGMGVEYQDTFTAVLERLSGRRTANLGVGAFGLTQMVRFLEKHAALIRPRWVVLTYGHWMTTRCFKRNTLYDVLDRPMYGRLPDGDLVLVEPGYCPSCRLVRRVLDDFRYPQTEHRFGPGDVLANLRWQWNMTWIRFRSGRLWHAGARRLGLSPWTIVEPDGRMDEKMIGFRAQVIQDFVNALDALSRRLDFKALIHHFFEFNLYDPEFASVRPHLTAERELVSLDGDLFRQAIDRIESGGERLVYRGPEEERDLYDAYLAERGLPPGRYRRPCSLIEDYHPNVVGHGLIGTCLAGQLRRHFPDIVPESRQGLSPAGTEGNL